MSGKGDVVVFLPGMMCGAWFWRYYKRLGDFPWGVCLQLSGLHGDGPSCRTFKAEVSDYIQQIKSLKSEEVVTIVAHSYGAQHALALAATPELNIKKLVLIAPALGRWWMVGAFIRILRVILQRKSIREAFIAKAELSELKGILLPALDGETPVRLYRPWTQVVSVVFQTGRGLGLNVANRVPVHVVWPEGEAVLSLPKKTDHQLVAGGHFLCLARPDIWAVIKDNLR